MAAAGFFVFNEFCKQENFEEKRIDILLSAIQSSLPDLEKGSKYTIEYLLEVSGWPKDIEIDQSLKLNIAEKATEKRIITEDGNEFKISEKGIKDAIKLRAVFNGLQERFEKSLQLRIKRDFPELIEKQVSLLASDIDSSLMQFFKEGGLSIASVIFSKGRKRTLPRSMFSYIRAASTRYDKITMRQAFFKASVDCFLHAENYEIDYLGRLSQGFFAFHGLGVFGDEAAERLRLANETVWLIDSDTQIRMLALGCFGNSLYRDCMKRLRKIGVRFFTTVNLLSETGIHLWFADNVIKEHGQNSLMVSASAQGEAPYDRKNLFMEGFVNWQAAGNPCDWKRYLFNIFGKHDFKEVNFEETLGVLGIEVIELEVWPGFLTLHHADIADYANQIVDRLQPYIEEEFENETGRGLDLYKKANPEAEACNIIRKEREGIYHIISEQGKEHLAWFISHTSMLNMLEENVIVTWQPEAFLSYASTLCDMTDAESTKQAFERIVLGMAQSGINLFDDTTIERVFGGVIEQARLDMEELREEYVELLERKYSESIDSVLGKMPAQYIPVAVTQIAAEIAQKEAEKRRSVEAESASKDQRIIQLEKKLKPLEEYKVKLLRRQSKKKKRNIRGKRG